MTSGIFGLASRSALTMVDVEHVIERHRDALIQHPFLTRLEGEGTIEQFRRLLPRLAFFTLVFQDLLRLTRDRCTDPRIRAIAAGLELGDKGHDQWYLDDLEHLRIPVDVRTIFSADHALSRDVAYALVSQVLSVNNDRSRLSIVLSLESTAREFFIRVTGFAERLGIANRLKYFGVHHLDAEKSHEVFGDEGQGQLATIDIPDQAVPEVLTAIEHTFEAMARLANDLESAMRDPDGDSAPSSASDHPRKP